MNLRATLPPTGPGLRVGLFGGSFNPAHDGHRLASLIALRRLGLDAVWWLVTPGNPLKDTDGLPSLETRIVAARKIAAHPRLFVTGVEGRLGTRYTADTLAALQRCLPEMRFIWIMGADNLIGFHRWRDWRAIAARMPIAVIDRPGATLKATAAPAARALARWRLDESDGVLLPTQHPPAWLFLHDRRSPLSSTRIRQMGTDAPTA